MSTADVDAVVRALERLPEERRRLLLEFAEFLATRETKPAPSVPRRHPADFCGALRPEIVEEMERAIEEACERIESDEAQTP